MPRHIVSHLNQDALNSLEIGKAAEIGICVVIIAVVLDKLSLAWANKQKDYFANLNFYQNGEHIDSILKGITIIEGKQHVDHHTLVHHIEPNCESHQDYKGIFDERSTGVFNGKIMVREDSQKIDAFQSNNTLLLSEDATINSKPQLEIYADDVKCSHGCTIGQLDKEALFYMRSRGIGKEEAQAILTYAFASEAINNITINKVAMLAKKLLINKLDVDLDHNI